RDLPLRPARRAQARRLRALRRDPDDGRGGPAVHPARGGGAHPGHALRDRGAEPARHLRGAGHGGRGSGGVSRMVTVVRREYLERVRSRAFLVSTILGPLLLAGVMIGPTVLMARQRGQPLRLSVVDATGVLAAPIQKALVETRSGQPPRFAVV